MAGAATKDAVLFLVDCSSSMEGSMGAVKETLSLLLTHKMVESKMNQVGVILFGVPEDETENRLAAHCEGEYRGIRVLADMGRPDLEVLRDVESIGASDSDVPSGDPLDAMIVGADAMNVRTANQKFQRHIFLVTDAMAEVQGADQLRDIMKPYQDGPIKFYVLLVGAAADYLASQNKIEPESSATHVMMENVKMYRSIARFLKGSVLNVADLHSILKVARKVARPTLSKTELSIGSKFKLKCEYFIRVSKAKGLSLSKGLLRQKQYEYHVAEPEGTESVPKDLYEKVKRMPTYVDPLETDEDVLFEYLVPGYRYGSEAIPVSSADEEAMRLSRELEDDGNAAMQVLGFLPSNHIHNSLFMGSSLVVQSARGMSASARGFGALVHAMRNKGVVAIVRFRKAARGEIKPKLGCLIPVEVSSNGPPQLAYQQLPFSEDTRDYTFPSFKQFSSKRRPSEKHLEATRDLVNALTLPPQQDGDEYIVGLDPAIQIMNHALLSRALDPEKPLPDPPASLKECVMPPAPSIERACGVREHYLSLFGLMNREDGASAPEKKIYFSDLASRWDAKYSWKQPGAVEKELGSKPTVPKCVGKDTPVPDFMSLVESAESCRSTDRLEQAVAQMEDVAIELLLQPDATLSCLQKGVNSLLSLKVVALRNNDGRRFNQYMQERVKGKLGDRGWSAVQEARVTLITTDQDSSVKNVSEEDSCLILSEPRLSSTPKAEDNTLKMEEYKTLSY